MSQLLVEEQTQGAGTAFAQLVCSTEVDALRTQLADVSSHWSASTSTSESTTAQHQTYDLTAWGWASDLHVLQQAAARLGIHASQGDPDAEEQQADHTRPQRARGSPPRDPKDSIPRLEQVLAASRAYLSPHCAASLAQALGVARLHEGGGVSAGVMPGPCDPHLEALRGAMKQHINTSWSQEAVRQGVAHAKAGSYEEARRCYSKALDLQPDNADALVARGAAYANERDLPAAAADLRAALALEPANANALRYLAAVEARAAQGGISLDPPPAEAAIAAADPAEGRPSQAQATSTDPMAVAVGGGDSQRKRRHGSDRLEENSMESGSSQSSSSTGSESSDEDAGRGARAAMQDDSVIKKALQAVLAKRKRSKKGKKHKKDSKKKDRKKGSKHKRKR